MTLADLLDLRDDIDVNDHRGKTLRDNRDRAILAHLTEGYTHQQIADATGLTRGRIGQIANTRKDNQ